MKENKELEQIKTYRLASSEQNWTPHRRVINYFNKNKNGERKWN